MNFLERLKNSWKGVAFGTLLGFTGPYIAKPLFESLQDRVKFPMYAKQIEWVRQAAKTMPCGLDAMTFQPLVQQVIEWNEEIVHQQEANRHWGTDLLTTDQWDAVQTIPLPCSGKDDP